DAADAPRSPAGPPGASSRASSPPGDALMSSRRTPLLLLVVLAAGCGDSMGDTTPHDMMPPPEDIPLGPTAATVDIKVAYEGYQHFLTTITASGHDMTGATLVPAPGETGLEVRNVTCNNMRCAVELRIPDTVSETAVPDPVPAPILVVNHFLD